LTAGALYHGFAMTTRAVLCYIRQDGRVLLQHKAPHRFGGGYWNAPGGKIANGESPEEATVREVREETGLTVSDVRYLGTLTFYVEGVEGPDIEAHVFVAGAFEGVVEANDEGPLEWVPEGALPYDKMWEDDRLWLPHVLAGHRVCGSFRFSAAYEKMLAHELEVE
jgi:8-oxo-dGTP diphosphatase